MVAEDELQARLQLDSIHGCQGGSQGGQTPSTAAARSTSTPNCSLAEEKQQARLELDVNPRVFFGEIIVILAGQWFSGLPLAIR